MHYRFYCVVEDTLNLFCPLVCLGLGSRDGSMGLWEVSEEVLNLAEKQQAEEGVPSYAHISHRALKDIPKEYTHPYNCKVRALAFNNSHKVSLCLRRFCCFSLNMYI